jgi:hypothetical protein
MWFLLCSKFTEYSWISTYTWRWDPDETRCLDGRQLVAWGIITSLRQHRQHDRLLTTLAKQYFVVSPTMTRISAGHGLQQVCCLSIGCDKQPARLRGWLTKNYPLMRAGRQTGHKCEVIRIKFYFLFVFGRQKLVSVFFGGLGTEFVVPVHFYAEWLSHNIQHSTSILPSPCS